MTTKHQQAPAGLTQTGGVAGVTDQPLQSPGRGFIKHGQRSAVGGSVFLRLLMRTQP